MKQRVIWRKLHERNHICIQQFWSLDNRILLQYESIENTKYDVNATGSLNIERAEYLFRCNMSDEFIFRIRWFFLKVFQ